MTRTKAFCISILWMLLYFGIRIITAVAVSMSDASFGGIKGAFGNITPENASVVLFVCSVITPLFILFSVKASGGRLSEALGFHRTSVFGIFISVLFLTLLVPVIKFVIPKLPFPAQLTQIYEKLSFLDVFGGASESLLASVVLLPLCEEIVFRGAVFTTLKGSFTTVFSAFVSSLFFALSFPSPQKGTVAFILGVLLCVIYVNFHSLWAVLFARTTFALVSEYFSLDVFPGAVQYIVLVLCAIGAFSIILWMISNAVKRYSYDNYAEEDEEE